MLIEYTKVKSRIFICIYKDKRFLSSKFVRNLSDINDIQKIDAEIKEIKLWEFLKRKIRYTEPYLSGTPFQKSVWNEISKIPLGTTTSYKSIALKIGKSGSSRAVANACGRNIFPLYIPCHRVIGYNGLIGGYKWGVEIKKYLLEYELNLIY